MAQLEKTKKDLPVNIKQILYNIISPNIGVCIWGRGSGKSVGPGAFFTVNNFYKMPCSNGFIQGTTYDQVLTKIIPAMVEGYDKLGLIKDTHYWIGSFPDKKLKIKKAIREPQYPDHYMKWHNGSGAYLVSQDRASTINGVRTQWGYIDEAKSINKKKFDNETLPTMLGGADLWGEMAPKYGRPHLAEYQSLLFTTDMPTHSNGNWLLEYEKHVDPKRIQLILSIHNEITDLKGKLITASPSEHGKINTRLDYLHHNYNKLRRDCIYYSEASAIDNIEFIGVGGIKRLRLNMSEIDFKVSVLNKKLKKIEKGFYGGLDPDVHGSTMPNYAYIDTVKDLQFKGKDRDCRWDGDVNQSRALEIAMDHNNLINCIATGQESPIEMRLLSSIHVDHPDLLPDCVKKWHEYYKFHPVKELHYWYDATSKSGGKNATNDIPFYVEVSALLRQLGWEVVEHYIGQIGSHSSRYHFWGTLLKGKDPRLPKFTYNTVTAESWEKSALMAGLKKVGKEFQKDKAPEKDQSIAPIETTHMTEAVDILVYGKYKPRFKSIDEYAGMIT